MTDEYCHNKEHNITVYMLPKKDMVQIRTLSKARYLVHSVHAGGASYNHLVFSSCSARFNSLYYLLSSAKGRGRELIKRLPYVRAFVRASVSQSVHHFFTYTLISHLFTKIYSPNLQEMFMAIKTCLCKVLAPF